MKAVILAAGVGSRLRPITNTMPKCLVQVCNKSILAYQIESYKYADIEEIIIVTGYLNEEINLFVNTNYPDLNITIVENLKFESTNNMYSLYLLKDIVKEEFILSNADVIFSKDMVYHLINRGDTNAICVDFTSFSEESMKLIVEENRIKKIAKNLEQSYSYGNSIDLYKFSKEARDLLFEEISLIIEEKEDEKSWTEVAIDLILDRIKFSPLHIENRFWYEIDNIEDLQNAEEIVKRYNQNEKKIKRN